MKINIFTLKKVMVDPAYIVPYLISLCLERSSAFSIGDVILSTVRKAARLAVYEEIIMRVKNHQIALTRRVELDLGATSEPEITRADMNVNLTVTLCDISREAIDVT